jgi:ABC-type transport system involved in multi-copper enzyme maturation permease subunit
MSDTVPMNRELDDSAALPGAAMAESADDGRLDEAAIASVATQGVRGVRRLRRPRLELGRRVRGAFAGMTAIGVKELRGRMRGRRAFVILTIYLLLLASFAWMVELILEKTYSSALGQSAAFASAPIGRGVFAALLLLETLLVAALAPAFTASSISLEREKQTLDMLVTTPVSSLSIVIGKLFSALTYLFILIFASIPLTTIVFVFGGVAPDDVVRGYLVLITTAIGLGSVGLFCSALVKRTQAATIVTYFAVLALTLGSFFVFYFWNSMSNGSGFATGGFGPLKGRPPEALNYFNPFFAQADVVCGVEEGFGDWCSRVSFIADRSIFATPTLGGNSNGGQVFGGGGVTPLKPGVNVNPAPIVNPGPIGPVDDPSGLQVQPFGVARDSFWPKTAVAWLVLSVVLVAASVQLVSPTRRWRPSAPRILRRSRRAAP